MRRRSKGYTTKQREGEIVAECIRYLQIKGYEVIRNNTGAIVAEYKGKKRLIRFGLPGSADILACSPDGRFVAIECKAGSNKTTRLQELFLNRIRENNGIAVVARSVADLVEAGI